MAMPWPGLPKSFAFGIYGVHVAEEMPHTIPCVPALSEEWLLLSPGDVAARCA